MSDFWIAFLFTLAAGLSTGIGSCSAFLMKHTSNQFLGFMLGFSAGVMIYVSMIEIYFKAQDALINELGEKTAEWVTAAAFFGGILIVALIDRMIPTGIPSEKGSKSGTDLMRMGVLTALAIAIHNFPEGIATFVSALQEPTVAVPIVVAIAIHNIPEGVAVSVPIYKATGSKSKAFFYSLFSGLTEPIGGILAGAVLMPVINDFIFGIIFASVAGIMVYISFNELLPTAREYAKGNIATTGFILGMAVMATSLLLF
ncbi:MAG: zinc transporter ZupT [Clostridia bacterium]|nr:zinc transporter ZupT [Clostridia bacterium]